MSPQSNHAVPLTKPGPNHSQREYVACTSVGIGFSAHRYSDTREVFHYAFPHDLGCVSVILGYWAPGKHAYLYHEFPRELDWIDRCRAAVEEFKQRNDAKPS